MCGLVGIFSSNMQFRHKEAMTDLLVLDTLRGRDSTGVAVIRNNGDTEIFKKTVTGFEFVDDPRFGNFVKLTDCCWIGHNRFGTVGKNVTTNAHPFGIEDVNGKIVIVGAHNGTLRNKHVLQDHQYFGTDSEAVYYHIAHNSVEETIPLLEGAWALTYFDHYNDELRFVRNKERPLHYVFEEDGKTLLWASEPWMLRAVCTRRDIKIKDDTIHSFDVDTLYKFPAPEKYNELLTFETEGGLAGKAPAFFRQTTTTTTTQTGGNANDKTSSRSQPQTTPQVEQKTPSSVTPKSTTTTPSLGVQQQTKNEQKSSLKPSNVSDINSAKTYRGYLGEPLSRRELQDRLDKGCGWCEEEMIPFGAKHAFLDSNTVVCSKCLNGSHETDKKVVVLH